LLQKPVFGKPITAHPHPSSSKTTTAPGV
jgi:hypothetical protein